MPPWQAFAAHSEAAKDCEYGVFSMRLALTTRQHAAALIGLLLIVPMLAACGGDAGSVATSVPTVGAGAGTLATAAPTGSPTAAPTVALANSGTAQRGGTLRILYWQAPTSLNPHQSRGAKDYDAASVTLEPLAHWSPDGMPVPALAAEIPTLENGDVSKDLKTITWKLKPGLKWSDGSPFSADDVVFTYQYCSDPATACTNQANYEPIATVEAVDPNTVKITWKAPNPNFYIAFVGYGGMVLQKKQFAACKGDQASDCAENNKPVGTGPYRVKSFNPGSDVVYEKNPNYRDASTVGFDTVDLTSGGDADAAARAVFQTGETDYAWNLQVEQAVLDQIMQGGKAELVNPAGPDVERVLINFANPDQALGTERSEPSQPHPFFSDKRVRQAFALAVDRKTMAEQLYGVTGTATCNIVVAPPDLASPNTHCDQDIAQAKQLLDAAGWRENSSGVREKDGKQLAVTFATTINPLRQKEQSLLQASWAKIGVQTDLKQISDGVFFSTDAGTLDTYGHFYWDLMVYANGADNPDPTVYLSGWSCEQVAARANDWSLSNNARYCDKSYDQLLGQLKMEADPAKRKALIIQMNDKLVNDAVIIPLINLTRVPGGKAKELQGPTGNAWDSSLWNIAEWHK
jgi:peptide/nickel transport system substrate-binding protein